VEKRINLLGMFMKKPIYSVEYKKRAVEMAIAKIKSQQEIARELGIADSTFELAPKNWTRK
jgi:transposase-like protein